ncbi:MAG: hypothetical protein IJU60_02440, partial [Acholeplasmatales bacterium]|nr:hypothetical protein [Acholeplasmatales bacterium]
MWYLGLADFFESQLAMLIYIIILFVLMVLTVLYLYIKEKRNVKLFNSVKELKAEDNVEKLTDKVTTHIDEKISNLSSQLNVADEKLEKIETFGVYGNIVGGEEITKEIEEHDDSRFFMLSKIDSEAKQYLDKKYDKEVSLEELCIKFRNFACHDLR